MFACWTKTLKQFFLTCCQLVFYLYTDWLIILAKTYEQNTVGLLCFFFFELLLYPSDMMLRVTEAHLF